jgi:UDP-GlcNAc:undecaprenyl-phosphate GlcNAc-1-phosphate transferase
MKSTTALYILIGILIPVFAYFTTLWIKRLAISLGIVDEPNQRSSHTETTPRGGGVAVVIIVVLSLVILRKPLGFTSNQFWGMIISSFLIACLGILDDIYTLRRLPRFMGWVVIAAISILFGIEITQISIPLLGQIKFGFLGPLITFLWLIGLTNFFNFMDGIDGLAAGEAIIVSGFLSVIAHLSGNELVFATSLIVFCAVLGFLPHNFPKAKLFMGDVGSNFLGYIFAALAVIGSQSGSGQIPFLIPVILLGMFILDAGITLIKRIPKGKEWLEPHRDHLYQRIIKLEYSHVQVTLLYSFLSFSLGILGLLVYKTNGLLALVLSAAFVIPYFALVMITVNREKKLKK